MAYGDLCSFLFPSPSSAAIALGHNLTDTKRQVLLCSYTPLMSNVSPSWECGPMGCGVESAS